MTFILKLFQGQPTWEHHVHINPYHLAVTGGGRPQHSVPRRPYNSIEAVKQAPHN